MNPLDAPCWRESCCMALPHDAHATIRLALYEARQAARTFFLDPSLASCWLDSAIETLADYHDAANALDEAWDANLSEPHFLDRTT